MPTPSSGRGDEEQLELGRDLPRGRRTGIIVVVVLALAAGWVAWRGGLGDDGHPSEQGRRPPGGVTRSPWPTGTAGGTAGIPAPEVAYLRSGVLLLPDGTRRGVPDVTWT